MLNVTLFHLSAVTNGSSETAAPEKKKKKKKKDADASAASESVLETTMDTSELRSVSFSVSVETPKVWMYPNFVENVSTVVWIKFSLVG